MKRIFFIEDELPNKITYYHLLAFVISLPFDLFYSEVILISLGIHTAINFRKDDFKRLKNRNLFILTSLYFLSLVCSLYTTNKDEALFDLTKELGLFIFPLIFCLTRLNISKYKDRLLLAFAMTCVCAILYLFIDSIRVICYYQLPISFLFSDSFLNQRFSEPLEIHATYLSMYVALSLVFLLYCFTNSAAMQKKVLTGLGCFILLIGLLQLASRAVFMAESIIVIIIFPFFISQKRIRIRFLSTSMLILLVALILLLKNESFKERYVEDLKDDFVSNFSSEGRVIRWKTIGELILQRPIIGYGTGSETKILRAKYLERKLYNSYNYGLNTHSEYLGYLLRAGIIGLFIFLFVISFGFFCALKNRDIVFLAFMTIITIVSFSENILDVNKGIFFFGFFFSFFTFSEGLPDKGRRASTV